MEFSDHFSLFRRQWCGFDCRLALGTRENEIFPGWRVYRTPIKLDHAEILALCGILKPNRRDCLFVRDCNNLALSLTVNFKKELRAETCVCELVILVYV